MYRLITENTSDSIAILSFDEHLRYLYVNQSQHNGDAFDPSYLIGKSFFDITHPDDKKRIAADLKKILAKKNQILEGKSPLPSVRILEFRIKSKDGKWRYMRSTINAFDNDKLLAVSKNITDLKEKDRLLRNSIDRAEHLLNISAGIILSLDTDGNITLLNDNGYKLLGYEKDELIGKNWFDTCIPKKLSKNTKKIFKKLMKGELETTIYHENSILTKDGKERIIYWYNTLLYDKNKNIEGVLSSGEDITEKEMTRQKIIDYQENLKTMTNELNTIEEKTKHQLATRLHDDIGQSMALSKITLATIKPNMPYSVIKKKIDTVNLFLTDAIKSSRDLTYELSPPILHELGLSSAIKWYTNQINKVFDIKFQISGIKKCNGGPENIRIILYKAVVELINNIVKHSKASMVTISIAQFKSFVRVIVRDNGIGFKNNSTKYLSKNKRFGLFNLKERISYIGGQFEIFSRPNKGTKITIRIPI